MPQLDPAGFTPQLIWLAITFVILYVLMARVALPRVGEVIEARQDKIAHDLEGAASYKTDAEAVLAEYEAAMAKARSGAQTLLAQAAEQRAQAAAERQARLDERLAERLSEAEARIARSKQAALEAVETAAGDIARAAAEKLIGGTIDDGAVNAALAAADEGGA